jgi:6-phospho-3-hexuloisomerase
MNHNDAVVISLEILKELKSGLKLVDPAQTAALEGAILSAKRIFIAGAGRSQLMMRGLAMRLMHFGFSAYVVGETVTPACAPGDLVIIGTGSGETATLAVIAANAKKIGATLGVITIYPDSTIARQADIVVQLYATTAKVKTPEGDTAFQPGGNTFEQSLLLLCDAMVMHLLEVKGVQDRNAVLMGAHANLE